MLYNNITVLLLLLFFIQIEALPEVINAVNGKVEVFLDGGVRLGTDAFKALALGAKAVFVGRPILWGLAYNVSYIFFLLQCSILIFCNCTPSYCYMQIKDDFFEYA